MAVRKKPRKLICAEVISGRVAWFAAEDGSAYFVPVKQLQTWQEADGGIQTVNVIRGSGLNGGSLDRLAEGEPAFLGTGLAKDEHLDGAIFGELAAKRMGSNGSGRAKPKKTKFIKPGPPVVFTSGEEE